MLSTAAHSHGTTTTLVRYDQVSSFSGLGVLHNAVVAWTIRRVGRLVEQSITSEVIDTRHRGHYHEQRGARTTRLRGVRPY